MMASRVQLVCLTLLVALCVTSHAATVNWRRVSASGGPAGRNGATMQYDAAKNRLIVFGGRVGSSGTFFDDTWAYSFADSKWTQINTATKPSARFSMVSGVSGDLMVVVTGEGPAKQFFGDEAWAFNMNNDTWEQIGPASGSKALDRYGSGGGTMMGSQIWMTHGFATTRYQDTWAFDPGTKQWVVKTPKGSLPVNRCLHASAVLAKDELMIMGGCASGGFGPCPLDDTWVLDSTGWHEVTSGTKPSGRLRTMATQYVNEGRNTRKAVLFAGTGKDDTLLFDGTTRTWKEFVTAASPSSREESAMCSVVPTSGKPFVALFGGKDAAGVAQNDLWVLEGDQAQLRELPLPMSTGMLYAAVGLIAVMGVLGAVATYTKLGLARFLVHRPLATYELDQKKVSAFFNPLYGTTWGEMIVVGLFVVASALAFVAGLTSTDFDLALAFGNLNAWLSAFVIVPATRVSVVQAVFGMPFERAVRYHRIIARTFWVSMLLHLVLIAASRPGFLDASATPVGLYGLLAFCTFSVLMVGGSGTFRRRFYKVFVLPHPFVGAVGLVFACLHQVVVLWYALGSVLLMLVSKAIAYGRAGRDTQLVSMTQLPGRVTRVEMRKEGFEYEGGQYLYLRVANVSAVEWHPFSISSHPQQDTVTVHVKDSGNGHFTSKLYELAGSGEAATAVVNIHGPYGVPSVRVEEYSTLVLVCGGIGVTPMVSMLGDLYHRVKAGSGSWNRVVFVWSVRQREELDKFADVLSMAAADEAHFDVRLFVTKGSAGGKGEGAGDKEGATLQGVEINQGRPDLAKVMQDAKAMTNEGNVGVFACGPQIVIRTVGNLAQETSDDTTRFDFHQEVFAF